jgi:4-hydroxy-3-methylbut-2-enyl diphosphate reductase
MRKPHYEIEIDSDSGFCFGVTRAISKAEEELADGKQLYCLGDIVHNGKECDRLKQMGLCTIEHDDLKNLHHAKVLLRAHGEPPTTYRMAETNDIEIIDATCPVVLALQRRIKKEYESAADKNRQIVIYGKNGHAEVLGLMGQTNGHSIVVENMDDVRRLDFNKDIRLYSQTTKSVKSFRQIVDYISSHIVPPATFESYDTICRQVANRMPNIRAFAQQHDIIFFVCGKKSSNGRVLFEECRSVNSNTFMVDNETDIDAHIETAFFQPKEHEKGVDDDRIYKIGICGATSTPKWLMERCKVRIQELLGSSE